MVRRERTKYEQSHESSTSRHTNCYNPHRSVIINGHVEILSSSSSELHLGDSFGITPTMEKLYHAGVMRTKCDDCQFVCVTQNDYYRILSQGAESQRRHTDDSGEVVLVTEHRKVRNTRSRRHFVRAVYVCMCLR